jgi:hypothetical protein
MTIEQFRKHPEYEVCMTKIRKYKKGFKFTIAYYKMTVGQANALKAVMRDAVEMGLVKSVAIGLSLEGVQTDETFEKVVEAV